MLNEEENITYKNKNHQITRHINDLGDVQFAAEIIKILEQQSYLVTVYNVFQYINSLSRLVQLSHLYRKSFPQLYIQF